MFLNLLTGVGDWLAKKYPQNKPYEKYAIHSPTILWLLSFSTDEETRKIIIYNDYLPRSAIKRLVRDSSPVIRETLVKTDCLGTAVLEMLVKDDSVRVRAAVASHERTSVEALRLLAQDEDSSVRENVAFNRGTPVAALNMLVFDEDESVRLRAAANPRLGADALRGIVATTMEPNICFGVAYNSNTPVDVLCKLLGCESREVANVVWGKVFALSDEAFNFVLITVGYGEFVGLPRDWVRKTLGVDGD